MKQIELQYDIVNNPPYSTTSLDVQRSLEVLVEAVNTINDALSDKICGCGIPFKNHGTGRNGYCTEPSKPSEENQGGASGSKRYIGGAEGSSTPLYQKGELTPDGVVSVMTESEVRADERARLRKKLEETELHYKDWSNKEAFFSKEDIDDLLK